LGLGYLRPKEGGLRLFHHSASLTVLRT